jgi:hypothetical protein
MTTTNQLELLEPIALHYLGGVIDKRLKDFEVPVGLHPLDRLHMTLIFPQGAAVERAVGNAGNGLEYYTATSRGLSLACVLLLLHKSGILKKTNTDVWVQLIEESITLGGKAEDLIPEEALQALVLVQRKLAAGCQATKKTPARRINVAGVDIKLRQK